MSESGEVKQENRGRGRFGGLTILFLLAVLAALGYVAYGELENIGWRPSTSGSGLQNSLADKVVAEDNTIVIGDYVENLRRDISELRNDMASQKSELEDLKREISGLKSVKIQYQPIPLKFEIIRLALDIEDLADAGKSFGSQLDQLQVIAGGSPQILEHIELLRRYIRHDVSAANIQKTLETETNHFLRSETVVGDGEVKIMLSRVFTVQKINDGERPFNPKSPDLWLYNLTTSLDRGEYPEAALVMEENQNYAKYFPKTRELIDARMGIDGAIISIVEYVLNPTEAGEQ